MLSPGHGCGFGGMNQRLPHPPEWLEMWRKLLTVDLMACFVHAFTLQDVVDGLSPLPMFPYEVMNPDWGNCIIPLEGEAIYHSEPLAQQAVLHVTGSLTGAILHLLEPIHLGSGRWSQVFIEAVHNYLKVIVDLEGKGLDDWSQNTIVQSLKALWREALANFVSLRQGVCQHDYTRGSDFNEFFD
jgi:hypothetical protein